MRGFCVCADDAGERGRQIGEGKKPMVRSRVLLSAVVAALAVTLAGCDETGVYSSSGFVAPVYAGGYYGAPYYGGGYYGGGYYGGGGGYYGGYGYRGGVYRRAGYYH